MAAKKKSTLGPKVRLLLEEALLEALKRHLNGKSTSSRRKRKSPAHKKKTGKKKAARRPTKKRARKTKARRR
jgi:hypothetical protein